MLGLVKIYFMDRSILLFMTSLLEDFVFGNDFIDYLYKIEDLEQKLRNIISKALRRIS